MSKTLNVGYNGIVCLDRVVAVVSPEGNPVKRVISGAKESNTLVDATHGRRTRSVVICDSGHVVLSALLPETIAARINSEPQPVQKRCDGEAAK